MKPEVEVKIIQNKLGKINKKIKNEIVNIVNLADLVRNSFAESDISSIMSPRTSIIWAQNIIIFDNVELAFKLTFYNKCNENDRKIISEFYQRCFGKEIA